MAIDIHSDTWEIITTTLKSERDTAVKHLINDRDSDKQRGKIALIDKILSLPDKPKDTPITQQPYL